MKTPHFDPNEKQDRARMIFAIALSLLILLAFNHFVDRPRMEEERRKQAVETEKKADVAIRKENDIVERAVALASAGARVEIRGEKVAGSLSLKGARLDDLTLNEHYKTVEKKEHVELLSPSNAEKSFYSESGWIGDNVPLPGPDTVWQKAPSSADAIVAGGKPVILRWDNGQGLYFEKEIALDDNYLFSVTDRVTNKGEAALKLTPYQLVSRHGLPDGFSGFFVLHEGPIGYLAGKEQNPDYDDLTEGEKLEIAKTTGWLGITDKYWMVSMLPPPDAAFDARVIGSGDMQKRPHFQADAVFATVELASGKTAEQKSHLYAGVKDTKVFKAYEETYGFRNLDLGIDFGMWHFITKPFYFLLHFLTTLTGNIAIAILLMTVIVRACVFPLASKSFRSMARMKVLAPKLKEIQAKYKDDKAKLQMEIYDLYKRENVNPMSGCWPMLIQIPVFFALYKVILISVELRHAPFWGWIPDLSAADPTSVFNLFGLIPWDPPALLMIGAWPVLYTITMVLQMRLSPPAPDPGQQMVHDLMPYMFGVMLAHFASGLVIYWTWSNVLGILQQYYVQRKYGTEEVSILRGHSARRKPKKKKDEK